MADTLVGKITHYYNKVGVAVVEVTKALKVGDKIKISGHDSEFTQAIDSMQIEHEQVEKAKKGQVVGMKVNQAVKENDEVYLVD